MERWARSNFARTPMTIWTDEDVDFLVQVARQIAIAVENALAYRQLHRNEGAARNREALSGGRNPARP
jgi:GAF domain-containing protein